MTDCGHLALIASGEARGLCPLCQKAEIERLRADNELLWGWQDQAKQAEAEIERLRAALGSAGYARALKECDDLRAEIERLLATLTVIVATDTIEKARKTAQLAINQTRVM